MRIRKLIEIAGFVFNETESNYFWSGGHRLLHQKAFEWIGGEAFGFENFVHGQIGKEGSCVAVQEEHGSWKSEDCFEDLPYVCQFEASQNVIPSEAEAIDESLKQLIESSIVLGDHSTTVIPETSEEIH